MIEVDVPLDFEQLLENYFLRTISKEKDFLDDFLVHATNPTNVDSIIYKGKIFPNSEFKKAGIKTKIAHPYPAEDSKKRNNDSFVYFSEPKSIIPECAINLHNEIKNPHYYIGVDSDPLFDIMTTRLYYNSQIIEKNTDLQQTDNKKPYEFRHKGAINSLEYLEAVVVPEENKYRFPGEIKDKVILVKGLTMNFLKEIRYHHPRPFVACMNYAFEQIKNPNHSLTNIRNPFI